MQEEESSLFSCGEGKDSIHNEDVEKLFFSQARIWFFFRCFENISFCIFIFLFSV